MNGAASSWLILCLLSRGLLPEALVLRTEGSRSRARRSRRRLVGLAESAAQPAALARSAATLQMVKENAWRLPRP